MSNDYTTWSFAKLKEEILAEAGSVNALANAGLLNEDTIRHLYSYHKNYQTDDANPEKPYYPENTQYWQDVVVPEVSVNLRKAVRAGRIHEVAHAIGLSDSATNDASGLITWEKTHKLIENDGQAGLILVYTGPQGGGKTNHALTMAEMELLVHDDSYILTNIKSAAEKHEYIVYVHSVDTLLDAVEEYGDCDGRLVFLFDEASSHATARTGKQHFVGQFGTFCRKLRKQGIDMYIIGHQTTDIAPTIRSLEGAKFVRKRDKYTATFYDHADDADEEENPILVQNNLNKANIEFATEEYTTWSWDGLERLEANENGQSDEEVAKDLGIDRETVIREHEEQMCHHMHEKGKSYADIASLLDIPESTVGRRVRDYRKRLDDPEGAAA